MAHRPDLNHETLWSGPWVLYLPHGLHESCRAGLACGLDPAPHAAQGVIQGVYCLWSLQQMTLKQALALGLVKNRPHWIQCSGLACSAHSVPDSCGICSAHSWSDSMCYMQHMLALPQGLLCKGHQQAARGLLCMWNWPQSWYAGLAWCRHHMQPMPWTLYAVYSACGTGSSPCTECSETPKRGQRVQLVGLDWSQAAQG